MKFMKDKVFIDTNVLVYAKLEDKNNQKKREVAIGLIQQIQDYPIIKLLEKLSKIQSSFLSTLR